MSDKGLLNVVQRIVADRDFREQFLIAPEAVLADLGVSAEVYRALAAVVPVLLAGSVALIDAAAGQPGNENTPVGWGRG